MGGMKVEGLVFAGVATADNDGVARFLADVLGVEVGTTGDVHRLAFPNGSSLALVPPGYVEPPSDTILGFLVDDLETAAAELSAKGIEPDGELASGWGLRYQHFRAPDGRRFELLDRKG
jgi:Glyoxalase/Bleomycin resistance protein/Dioxygenase superfamily